MKRPTTLEAVKKLRVLKCSRSRDRSRGRALLQIPGNRHPISAEWRREANGGIVLCMMKGEPIGWAELSKENQLKGRRDILHAINWHEAKTARRGGG